LTDFSTTKAMVQRQCLSKVLAFIIPETTVTKPILMVTMILVATVGRAQHANDLPAIDPPVHNLSTNGMLRIRLNGAITDWLLGANVAAVGAMAKVQVFEMDRDFKNDMSKRMGHGFAKSVSYPAVNVLGNTVQINVGSHDTTTVYVEAPAWTTVVVTGPNDEVLYQTYLRKTLLVSRGVEVKGPTRRDFRMLLPLSDRTHEARVPPPVSRTARDILQTRH
jgi:hypothetical protein